MSTRADYITVSGLQTRVLTVGGWIDAPLPDKHVVLVIPGNPGLVSFYTPFLVALHKQLGVPVWAVSHAGHDLPTRSNERLADHLDDYTVAGQTRHKLAFIQQYIASDARITLVGHSIGCKIIMNLMGELNKRVDKCYLLFPTIERMADTPNGRFLNGVIKPFVFFIVLASWLVHILPFCLKRFLISLWFLTQGTCTEMSGVVVRLVRPKILRNVFYMAYDEMDHVTELDQPCIERYAEKLVLYYGLKDGWAPLTYSARLKQLIPSVRVMVCDRGFDHAFVLDEAEAVGNMVGEWVRDDRGRQE